MRLIPDASRRRVAMIAQSLVVALAVAVTLGANDVGGRFDKLGGKLMCTCGCAQTLTGCDHVGCPSRGEEMDKLRAGLTSGLADGAILDSMVKDYGTVVLAAPPAKGFDLLAWVMPFLVAGIALVGTIFLVRHWAKQQPQLSGNELRGPDDDAMRERIRRETGTE